MTAKARIRNSRSSRSTAPSSNFRYLRTFLQLCALLSIASISTAEDFYKLLGISRRATSKEIKKAYRQKSLEFHPDKNKAEGAAEKFAEIARAYEVLSDESKKEIYDRHGEEGLKRHEERGGGGGGFGGGFGGDPFEDMFGQFGFGGGRRRDSGERRTDSVNVPLHLNLKQLYLGEMLEVHYVRQVLCKNWEDCMRKDPECSGPGVKIARQQIAPGFVQQVQMNAPQCVARGKSWRKDCKACPKGKTESEKIELTIDVNKGMRHGEHITFEKVADEKPGYIAGDLNFLIVETPHSDFRRDGDHLYLTREIPLVDALVGFTLELSHVDGHKFTVEVDGVTECDHVMRVPGKGMPRRSGRGFGDLYLTFEVDFPDTLSEKQKKAIREIFTENDEKTGGDKDDEL